MRMRRVLEREDDSQNCYVYKSVLGPGMTIIKVWLPRRLVGEPPEHINAVITVED